MSKEKAAFSGSLASGNLHGDSNTEAPIQSTTTAAQRLKIHQLLRQRPYSTLELRALGICSPAPRVKELRNSGLDIVTTWREETDSAGVVHRIGVYVLQAEDEGVQP